jgi:hypothetical protein
MRSREFVWIKYKMSLKTKAEMDDMFRYWKLAYEICFVNKD